MFIISSNFIGTFKIGDNIHYNLRVLVILYQQFEAGDNETKRLLCKPISVLIISIIEAVLYDFYLRCRMFTREGVATLAESALHYFRTLEKDEFYTAIESAKNHKLFGATEDFYAQLHELRKLRNRVHIQNKKNDLERDDRNAFTIDRKNKSEGALEAVMKILSRDHPRPAHIQGILDDFQLPWQERYQ